MPKRPMLQRGVLKLVLSAGVSGGFVGCKTPKASFDAGQGGSEVKAVSQGQTSKLLSRRVDGKARFYTRHVVMVQDVKTTSLGQGRVGLSRVKVGLPDDASEAEALSVFRNEGEMDWVTWDSGRSKQLRLISGLQAQESGASSTQRSGSKAVHYLDGAETVHIVGCLIEQTDESELTDVIKVPRLPGELNQPGSIQTNALPISQVRWSFEVLPAFRSGSERESLYYANPSNASESLTGAFFSNKAQESATETRMINEIIASKGAVGHACRSLSGPVNTTKAFFSTGVEALRIEGRAPSQINFRYLDDVRQTFSSSKSFLQNNTGNIVPLGIFLFYFLQGNVKNSFFLAPVIQGIGGNAFQSNAVYNSAKGLFENAPNNYRDLIGQNQTVDLYLPADLQILAGLELFVAQIQETANRLFRQHVVSMMRRYPDAVASWLQQGERLGDVSVIARLSDGSQTSLELDKYLDTYSMYNSAEEARFAAVDQSQGELAALAWQEIHKRVYSFVESYPRDANALFNGVLTYVFNRKALNEYSEPEHLFLNLNIDYHEYNVREADKLERKAWLANLNPFNVFKKTEIAYNKPRSGEVLNERWHRKNLFDIFSTLRKVGEKDESSTDYLDKWRQPLTAFKQLRRDPLFFAPNVDLSESRAADVAFESYRLLLRQMLYVSQDKKQELSLESQVLRQAESDTASIDELVSEDTVLDLITVKYTLERLARFKNANPKPVANLGAWLERVSSGKDLAGAELQQFSRALDEMVSLLEGIDKLGQLEVLFPGMARKLCASQAQTESTRRFCQIAQYFRASSGSYRAGFQKALSLCRRATSSQSRFGGKCDALPSLLAMRKLKELCLVKDKSRSTRGQPESQARPWAECRSRMEANLPFATALGFWPLYRQERLSASFLLKELQRLEDWGAGNIDSSRNSDYKVLKNLLRGAASASKKE